MPKPPPPHPAVIGAQRFFARNRTMDLECPSCGKLYQLRTESKLSVWNPRTGIFCCNGFGGCERKYVLGVLAWPKGLGSGSGAPPADQVPGPRQLAELDPNGAGWWLPDEYKHKGRPDPTNLTGETERLPEEDAEDVRMAVSDADDAPRCFQCMNAYSPNKSNAKNRKLYCSATCEEKAP